MRPLDHPILFLATSNPQASRDFYERVLGLKFIADEPFALVFQVGPSTLRIAKVQTVHAAPYTVLGWAVSDIRATVKQLRESGVKFEHYEGMNQDADAIWKSPSGEQIAWFKDPQAHVLSLTQYAT